MKNKKSNKNTKVNMMISCIIIVFILTFLFALVFAIKNKNTTKVEIIEENSEKQIENKENDLKISRLKNMEERDRMEFYFSVFLDYIESEKYENAYELLYDEFKNNYFPTLEQFEDYSKNTFTEMSNIVHDNIERNGDVYVLWVHITDAINGKPGEKKEMNFVIRENDYNDFELSFSVK